MVRVIDLVKDRRAHLAHAAIFVEQDGSTKSLMPDGCRNQAITPIIPPGLASIGEMGILQQLGDLDGSIRTFLHKA